jgi:hypothetical protein
MLKKAMWSEARAAWLDSRDPLAFANRSMENGLLIEPGLDYQKKRHIA